MIDTTREALIENGVAPEHIHVELFFGYSEGSGPSRTIENAQQSAVTVLLGGQQTSYDLPPDESVLDGALTVRDDVPYACMGGACSTCRAKVIEGSCEMDANYALHQDDLDRGYVLTCQSYATSPKLVLDYDA
ncbi:MAG: 2Fe-2S iron-sulfur cluster-binding protein [Solirubrobacteraceae bacterium]